MMDIEFNGQTFSVPNRAGETDWSGLTSYIQALAAASTRTGVETLTNKTLASPTFTGSPNLTGIGAEISLGSTYGLKTPYIKAATGTVATTGLVRLPNDTWGMVWKTSDALDNFGLKVNVAGQLVFGNTVGSGTALVTETASQTLTNKTLTNPTINAAALSGTFSGTPTFSGVSTFSSRIVSGTSNTLPSSGFIRLNPADTMGWTDGVNNRLLSFSSPDRLIWNGQDVVTTSASQTLTNKTLTSPVINTSTTVAPTILMFGALTTPSGAGSSFFLYPFGGEVAAAAGTFNGEFRIPFACKLSNMYVQANTGPAAGSITFQMYKNGGSTALTATLATAATQAADTSNTVTFAAGDRVYIAGTNSGSAGAAKVFITVMCTQA